MFFFCQELQSTNTLLPYCQNYFSVKKILVSLVYLTDLKNYLRSSPLASYMRWGKWNFTFTCLLSWWQEVVKSLQVLLFSWATTNQTSEQQSLLRSLRWLQGQILILLWPVVLWESPNIASWHSSLLHVGWHCAVSCFCTPRRLQWAASCACLSLLCPIHSSSSGSAIFSLLPAFSDV